MYNHRKTFVFNIWIWWFFSKKVWYTETVTRSPEIQGGEYHEFRFFCHS